MSNKDMPVITITLEPAKQSVLLLALNSAYGELYSNDARKDVREMIEFVKSARAAALAELERRNQQAVEGDRS